MSQRGSQTASPGLPTPAPVTEATEHLDIKIVDDHGVETVFKIKASTKLGKVINAWCDRQSKNAGSLRFLFEGTRVVDTDTPISLEMVNGDIIEVHQEQIGGGLPLIY